MGCGVCERERGVRGFRINDYDIMSRPRFFQSSKKLNPPPPPNLSYLPLSPISLSPSPAPLTLRGCHSIFHLLSKLLLPLLPLSLFQISRFYFSIFLSSVFYCPNIHLSNVHSRGLSSKCQSHPFEFECFDFIKNCVWIWWVLNFIFIIM